MSNPRPIPESYICHCAGVASHIQGTRYLFCLPHRIGTRKDLTSGAELACYLLVTSLSFTQKQVAASYNVDPRRIAKAVSQIVSDRERFPDYDRDIDRMEVEILTRYGNGGRHKMGRAS